MGSNLALGPGEGAGVVAFLGSQHLFDVGFGPLPQGFHRGRERLTQRRKAVLDCDGDRGSDFAGHQPVPFQNLERLREHFLGKSLDLPAQLVKTLGALVQ